MKKVKKILLSLICTLVIGAGVISSADAVAQSKTATVSGGKITAYATHNPTGNTRWTYNYASSLNSYDNVKSNGVSNYRNPIITDAKLDLYAQLYKVDYSYNTTYLGKATFTFYK